MTLNLETVDGKQGTRVPGPGSGASSQGLWLLGGFSGLRVYVPPILQVTLNPNSVWGLCVSRAVSASVARGIG